MMKLYPALALAALATVKSQVVHVVTTPASAAVANQPLWTTLCDDACDTIALDLVCSHL
jgi:hypothetical protein